MTERERAQDAALLPCPFCGLSKIDVRTRKNTIVECTQCGALFIRKVRHAAVAAWNNRPARWDTTMDTISDNGSAGKPRAAPPPDARDETIRRLREDEVRLDWLIENATTTGDGHGFTLTVFIPHDSEDVRGAIDAARAALKDAP